MPNVIKFSDIKEEKSNHATMKNRCVVVFLCSFREKSMTKRQTKKSV